MTLTQVAGYDEARSIATVHAALDAGVNFIDTADVYGPPGSGYGVNELVVAKALRTYRGSTDGVVVATKGGHLRYAETDTWWLDGRPEHLHRACRESLRRLGYDALPLYQHHRPDPQVPYAESIGALRELYEQGLVRRVGISNANDEQIRSARDILGDALVAVQNEYSPAARGSESQIRLCERLGIAFLSWGPLGGMRAAKQFGSVHAAFAEVAAARGVSELASEPMSSALPGARLPAPVSAQRVALAWQLRSSPVIVPIPGASRPESVLDSVAAVDLVLTPEECARLDGQLASGTLPK